MIQVDTQDISFSNEDQKTVTFSDAFLGLPAISVVPENQNIEFFASNITVTGFTLNASSRFTGNVKIIATRG